MSASTSVPVLFYSERCANSKEVVQTIQALNKASLFRFVCVDTTPRQYIPQEIKSVPTVINPQTKELVVGKAAIFAKLSKPVDSRREIPQQRTGPAATGSVDPQEWSFNEVKGLSTTFSIFDEKSQIPENQYMYSFINGIRTSGEESIAPDGRASDDPSKILEKMQATRDAEFRHTTRS
jgi:hypothetical protein